MTPLATVVLIPFLALLAAWQYRRFGLPASRGGRALLATILILGLHVCQVQLQEIQHVLDRETDFGTLHLAATVLSTGGDPYAATDGAFFQPPFAALLMTPAARLPAAWASLLFFCLKLFLVVWSLDAARRLTGGGTRPLFVFGLIFAAAKFWLDDLQFGNTNILTMALVIAAIEGDRRDQPWSAGLALAVAGSIKIVPLVLLVHFVAARRWRTVAACAGGCALLNLAPFAVAPHSWSAAWSSYWQTGVADKLGSAIAEPVNQSLWGWLHRTFPAAADTKLLVAWAASGLALLAVAAWLSHRTRRRTDLTRLAAAALYPVLGLVISPGSWVVHYTAVLLPMVLLWRLALEGIRPARTPWALFLALNLAFTASGWSRVTVDASLRQSWFLAAAFVLLGWLGWWTLRFGTETRPAPAEAGAGRAQ